MWLFEKRGFISVVAYDPKKDRNKASKFRTIAKNGETHLLVRARVKEDLDWLKAAEKDLHVETDESADYAFRAVITRERFKTALANSVDEIDYDSHFKEVASAHSPKAPGRYNAMMGVWNKMVELQPIKPWSGATSSWTTGKPTSVKTSQPRGRK